MAVLNFPQNPTPGQTYVIGNVTWSWNGYAWVKFTSIVQSTTSTQITNTVSITTSTSATNVTSGALVVNGGAGIQGDTFVGGVVSITNTTTATSTVTGALVVSGGAGIQGDVWVSGRLHAESVKIAETIFDSTKSTTTNNASVVIDAYDINAYRGAKYLIQIDENTGTNYQISEMLLLVAGTTPYKTEYAPVSSNGDLGTFQPMVVGDSMILYLHPSTSSFLTINVLRQGVIK